MAQLSFIRRSKALLVAMICLLLAPLSQASQKTAPPFFAFCMDTHDSQKRDLGQQAALLKELGYDGAGHLWLDGLEERLRTLDAQGLKLCQVYLRVSLAPGKDPYDKRLKEKLALLAGRKTQLALIMKGLPPSDQAGDARAVAIIREIAALAQPHGLRVTLYPHSGDWLERVEDALRLIQQVQRPNVGLMFNLCHWLKVDKEERLRPLLKAALPHLYAVSIHGADSAAAIQNGAGNWIQPLGQGDYDTHALLKVLKKLGYAGPVGLQCYGLPGDARDHLAHSIATWEAWGVEF